MGLQVYVLRSYFRNIVINANMFSVYAIRFTIVQAFSTFYVQMEGLRMVSIDLHYTIYIKDLIRTCIRYLQCFVHKQVCT